MNAFGRVKGARFRAWNTKDAGIRCGCMHRLSTAAFGLPQALMRGRACLSAGRGEAVADLHRGSPGDGASAGVFLQRRSTRWRQLARYQQQRWRLGPLHPGPGACGPVDVLMLHTAVSQEHRRHRPAMSHCRTVPSSQRSGKNYEGPPVNDVVPCD